MKYYLMTFCLGLIIGSLAMHFYQRKDPKEEIVRNYKKGESKINVTKGKETTKEKWVEKNNVAVLNNPDTAITTRESRYKVILEDSSYAGKLDIVTHPRTDSIKVFSSIKVREVERMRVDTVLISRVDTLETVKTVEKPDPAAFKNGLLTGIGISAAAVAVVIILL